jgi:hypothetical protein
MVHCASILQLKQNNYPQTTFFTLQSTFFCHTEGVKYKEQTMPFACILTNRKAKWTMKSELNYTLEGEITPTRSKYYVYHRGRIRGLVKKI